MRRLAVTAAIALVLALGCSDEDGLGSDEARLTLLLTDAPGDVTAAVVTISSIYLQGSSDEESDDQDGRVYLRTEPVTTDLLTLVDDVATLVDGVVIPAGDYGQIRFVIEGAYLEIETDDGGTEIFATPGYAEAPETVAGELKCPSCSQSGIKVNFQGALNLEGEDETLLVDFDVSETFGKEAGNSGKWVMQPSLKGSRVEG